MRLRLAALAISLVTFAPHASAHWQYTKWNMSPQQVVAVSKGAAVALDEEESKKHSATDGSQFAKLKAPYSSGNFQFNAYFQFNAASKLCDVDLELIQGDGNSLIGALRTKYGKPVSDDSSEVIETLIWYSAGDMISIVKIGNLTTVGYRPRLTADNSGL